MTETLCDGPAVGQMQAGGNNPNEDCGEAILRAIGLQFGMDWSVRYIESCMPNPAGGTDVPSQVAFLNAHGLPAVRRRTDIATRVNGAVSRRHLSNSLVSSDRRGNPTPRGGVGHFLEDLSTYPWRTMNPAYGQFLIYPNLTACDLYDGLEVMARSPCDQQPQPHPPITKDEDMTYLVSIPEIGQTWQYTPSGKLYLHVTDAQSQASWQQTPNYASWTITKAQHQALLAACGAAAVV
jgi:hypothetical protein